MCDDNTVENYNGHAELLLMDVMKNYNHKIANLMKSLDVSFENVLDFGAGIGTLARIMSPLCEKLTCLEIDEAQSFYLKEAGFNCVSSLNFIKNNSLSFIYASNVLEHIEDELSILKNLRIKLKCDGKIFIYVPAFQFLYTAMDKKVGHYRRYNKKNLKRVLVESGYKVDEIFYTDPIGCLAALIFKLSKKIKLNKDHLLFFDQYLFPLNKFIEFFSKGIFGKNLVVIASKQR